MELGLNSRANQPMVRRKKPAVVRAGLVRQHFDVGRAAVVIDGDVDVFPAGADAAAPVRMNAVPDAQDAPERLDIEMDQLAGARALVAVHGRAAVRDGPVD